VTASGASAMKPDVLKAADVKALIERFDDPDLIASGILHVLAFDAIRDRSGRRWPLRQDSVREFIERQFHKHFHPADHLVRLDDVHFMVVQPRETRAGAQGRALRLMSEILNHFLGASARSDVRLSQVARLGPDGVEVAPIDVSDADLAALARLDWAPAPGREGEAGSGSRASAPPAAAVGAGVAAAPPLLGDRAYEALFVVEPVWGIRQKAVVSYLLRPLVFEHMPEGLVNADLAKATSRDLLSLNLMVLDEARRLFSEQGARKRFVLYVPIHHATLGVISGRQALLSALQRMRPLATSSVVVVLTGLDPGMPHARMLELTSLLTGHCRAVVALAPGLECKIERWRDSHLSGVALDLSDLPHAATPLTAKRLSDFAARFQGVAPALIAYSAPNSAVLMMAWGAGFTHVGGDLIARCASRALQPLRLDPIDLYRRSA
jgi:hypothetical protein